MLDLMTRACLHPIDYFGVCRITNLKFKEKIQESDNIYSFVFTAKNLPRYKAGQHAIFTLPGKSVQGKTWRPFSVAAAPHENIIRIGTTFPETPSDFKQKLQALQPGDNVRMFGPFGEFYVRPHTKQVVGVAGGIGITPLRAIISDLTKKHSPTKLTLIYSAKDDLYTYKDELESWQQENRNLKLVYTANPEEVNAALSEETKRYGNTASYLISGAPGMIKAIRESLENQGIKKIYNDPFKGY